MPKLFLLLIFSLLTSCSTTKSHSQLWSSDNSKLAWPAAPDEPRIKYLRSVNGPSDFNDKSLTKKAYNWITGENNIGLPFVAPYGIIADGNGRIWVADFGISGIHAIDLNKNHIDYIKTINDIPLRSPVGLAISREKNKIFISDSILNKIFITDKNGDYLGELNPPNGYGRPGGLSVDKDGNTYVVDVIKNCIFVFSENGEYISTIKSSAPPDFTFKSPSNVANDIQGNTFITDTMNFRVECISQSREPCGTIGEAGDGPGLFARPRGVATDSDGNIYVADATFDNIQIFNKNGQLLLVIGRSGNNAGEFSMPSGLYIDNNDRLYVTDTFNGRIQIFQYLSTAHRN